MSQTHSARFVGSPDTRSVVFFKRNPSARLRLICFPYAGGGASVYSSWHRNLPSEVEVCAVQMPGREDRIGESPLTSYDVAVDWLVTELGPWMDKPFALFGHSLGAMLSFEVARRISRDRPRRFTHLFVSGKRAPHLPVYEPPTYSLPDEEFGNELRRLSGTPEEVLQEPELMSVLMPLLRADFRLSQTYTYRYSSPLGVPITAYGGIEDADVSPEQVEAWRELTTAAFRHKIFPGGHFFVVENSAALFAAMVPELEAITAAV